MSVNRIVLMISALNHSLKAKPVLYFPLTMSMTVTGAGLRPRPGQARPGVLDRTEGTWLWAGSAEAGCVGTKR